MGSFRVGKLKDNHKDSATHIRRRFLLAPKESTKHNVLYNTIKTSVSLAALLGQRASHRVRLASLRHIAFDRGCQCTPLHGFCGRSQSRDSHTKRSSLFWHLYLRPGSASNANCDWDPLTMLAFAHRTAAVFCQNWEGRSWSLSSSWVEILRIWVIARAHITEWNGKKVMDNVWRSGCVLQSKSRMKIVYFEPS